MESLYTIRLAEKQDVPAMLEIYRHYVLHTVITFDYDVPSLAEFEEKIRGIQMNHPCLVVLQNDKIAGYAYGNEFRHKAAYQWCVESTVYLDKDVVGKGLGKALYTALFEIMALQGFYKVYAGVTLPNPLSEKLHLSTGFKELVVYEEVGFKAGAWHDTIWYELTLGSLQSDPQKPKPIDEVSQSATFRAILDEANRKLQ